MVTQEQVPNVNNMHKNVKCLGLKLDPFKMAEATGKTRYATQATARLKQIYLQADWSQSKKTCCTVKEQTANE